jgi:superfamily II DNA/RNA helicase
MSSPVSTPTAFAALGVPADIDAGLAAAGFAAPFAIQTAAIPVAMKGHDVCGRARTGSGKTLAFGVPALARINKNAAPRFPHGLVLVPTRELALQVAGHAGPRRSDAVCTITPTCRGITGFNIHVHSYYICLSVMTLSPAGAGLVK